MLLWLKFVKKCILAMIGEIIVNLQPDSKYMQHI